MAVHIGLKEACIAAHPVTPMKTKCRYIGVGHTKMFAVVTRELSGLGEGHRAAERLSVGFGRHTVLSQCYAIQR